MLHRHKQYFGLAVKRGNKYYITRFDFCNDVIDIKARDTVDVNGDGMNEVIITWSNYLSSWSEMGGYNGSEENFLIWDLKTNQPLLAWKLSRSVTGYNYCFGTSHSGFHYNYQVNCAGNKISVTDLQYPLPQPVKNKNRNLSHNTREEISIEQEERPLTTHKKVMEYTYSNGMFVKTYQLSK